jgi:hypothetical protein
VAGVVEVGWCRGAAVSGMAIQHWVYCNSARLTCSLSMCYLRASVRWAAACLLMINSCFYQSLSISCCAMISSLSSASASSSSASS